MYGLKTNEGCAMTMREFGDKLYKYVAEPIGIMFVMFGILLGVSKFWDKSWNLAIKITMILVIFVVELACVFVLPFGIGKEARSLFGKIF